MGGKMTRSRRLELYGELHQAGTRLISLERYEQVAHQDWRAISQTAFTLDEIRAYLNNGGTALGVVCGFGSGMVYVVAEQEAGRAHVANRFHAGARWSPYQSFGASGYLTGFKHQGRAVFDEFFGERAPQAVERVLGGSYRPELQDKTSIIRGEAITLSAPEISRYHVESGPRILADHGIIHVFGDGEFLLLGDFDPRCVESGVIFRSSWLAYSKNSEKVTS